MRAFLETQLPGGSAHHLQAALYTQGLLYHDSKTRRNGVAPLARPEELLEELAIECRRNCCALCLTKSHSLQRSRLPPSHSPHHLSTRLATSTRCSAYPNSFTTSPLVSPRLATSLLVSSPSAHITNSPPLLSSHHLSSGVATSPLISSPLDSSRRPFTRLTTSPLIAPPLHLFHHLSTRLTTSLPLYPYLHYPRSHPRTSSPNLLSASLHPLPTLCPPTLAIVLCDLIQCPPHLPPILHRRDVYLSRLAQKQARLSEALRGDKRNARLAVRRAEKARFMQTHSGVPRLFSVSCRHPP